MSERERFEAAMKALGYGYSEPMLYADRCAYRSHVWQAMWDSWQARAALDVNLMERNSAKPDGTDPGAL